MLEIIQNSPNKTLLKSENMKSCNKAYYTSDTVHHVARSEGFGIVCGIHVVELLTNIKELSVNMIHMIKSSTNVLQ